MPLLLLAGVLLVHACLLGAVPLGLGEGADRGPGGARKTVLVRHIEAPVAPPAKVDAPAAATVAAPPAPLVPTAPTAAAPARVAAAPAASEPAAFDPAANTAAAAANEPLAVATAAEAAAPAAASGEHSSQPPPVYATRPPAPVLLRYQLKRGALSGSGELAWRPADGHYQMTMEGTVFGITVLNWVSQGGFDGAGIAPERFVDRRRGRDVLAANFQRDKGLITFSGPQVTYPLLPGSQDRLSWLLQLPAIVQAEPAKFGPGASISFFVVGARGDGELWTFTVEGHESLQLPIGRIEGALRLRREPHQPYDTLGEVWLDPAHSYLPARVRLSVPQSGESTEFLLREMTTP